MAELNVSRLHAAATTLAEVLSDPMTAGDAGPAFTCNEAEAIAEVMRAVGLDEAAEAWIAGHAAGDDEGDDHHPETQEG